MYVDIICLALMALLFVLGVISGFLSQIIRIAALVAACLLASPLSPYAEDLLMKKIEVDSGLGHMLSLFLAWLASYVVLILIGAIVARIIRGSSKSLKFLDRVLGGVLGGLKGALIVYLAVCAILVFQKPLEKFISPDYLELKGSRLAAFARDNNILQRLDLPDAGKLSDVVSALANEKQRKTLARDPIIKKIQQTPVFQELLQDSDFTKAASEKNLGKILKNKGFQKAVNDPEIRKLLSEVDLKSIQNKD